MKKTFKIKNYKGNIVESLKIFSKKYPEIKICEATEKKNDELSIVTEDSKADELAVLRSLKIIFRNQNLLFDENDELHELQVIKQCGKNDLDKFKKAGPFIARTGASNRMKDIAVYIPFLSEDIVFIEVKKENDPTKLINIEFKYDPTSKSIVGTRPVADKTLYGVQRSEDQWFGDLKKFIDRTTGMLVKVIEEKGYTSISQLTKDDIANITAKRDKDGNIVPTNKTSGTFITGNIRSGSRIHEILKDEFITPDANCAYVQMGADPYNSQLFLVDKENNPLFFRGQEGEELPELTEAYNNLVVRIYFRNITSTGGNTRLVGDIGLSRKVEQIASLADINSKYPVVVKNGTRY